MKILVLIPMKKNLHPELKRITVDNLGKFIERNENDGIEISAMIDSRGDGDGHVKNHHERVVHTASIRQSMVDEYLKDHEFVLWWDADLTIVPSDLLQQLFQYYPSSHTPKAILAPWVYVETSMKDDNPKFYDIAGFIYRHDDKLRNIEHHKPYIRSGMTQGYYAYDMESVGCCCLIPADVYRKGAKHEASKQYPQYTDGWGISQFAKGMGYKVLSIPYVKVGHANLENYQEGWH